MLEERNPQEIIDYIKEKMNCSTGNFTLRRIYNMARAGFEQQEIRNKLIEIAGIPMGLITRKLIIDNDNAIFEVTKDKERYSTIIIDGKKSDNLYLTFEQGLLGWLCERQGFADITPHLFRMLEMK